MHIMMDTELRHWTHPTIPMELSQPWTVQGDSSCDADCSDITSSNDSSNSSLNSWASHKEVRDSSTRRTQRREGSRLGLHNGHINTAILTQTISSITARQIDSQILSSGSHDTTGTEDDMMLCTTVQSRTYGRLIAPIVKFAHVMHRTWFGPMDAQEESASPDSHTSD